MEDSIKTKKQLLERMAGLGNISPGTKKTVVCALVGHSRIVDSCWGYITCSRCAAQLGDTLGGSFDLKEYVVVGHNCKVCKKIFATLTWKDKYLAPDPFKK
jgi:hypothetical protein